MLFCFVGYEGHGEDFLGISRTIKGHPLFFPSSRQFSGAVAGELEELLKGESHTPNLIILFLSCLVILSCLLSNIKNTKKISFLLLVYFQFVFCLVIMSGSAHYVLAPEIEVRSFKQQGGESLKDAWYRISDAHRRCTKKNIPP